jgi:uridine kinase
MVHTKEHLLVGISGPTSAGKTTLVEAIKRKIGPSQIAVVSVDWYDRERRGDSEMKKAVVRRQYFGEPFNWESPEVFDFDRYIFDLRRMKKGNPTTITSPNSRWQKGTTIAPAKFTIVEGTLALYDKAASFFDIKYYIDLPLEEVVRRRLKKVPEHRTAPAYNLQYMGTVMLEGLETYVFPQKKKADVVLDGTQPTARLAERVIHDLRSL